MKTTIGLICISLTMLGGNIFAASSVIHGVVKDANGRPLRGADIRIEASGGSSWSKMTKTDANGRYSQSDLAAGNTYRVSILVNSVVKASINNVKTNASEPTQLNFDLKTNKTSVANAKAKAGKHYVWVPGQTGTHLGGHWAEVTSEGTEGAGSERVEKLSRKAVERMQNTSGRVNEAGGH